MDLLLNMKSIWKCTYYNCFWYRTVRHSIGTVHMRIIMLAIRIIIFFTFPRSPAAARITLPRFPAIAITQPAPTSPVFLFILYCIIFILSTGGSKFNLLLVDPLATRECRAIADVRKVKLRIYRLACWLACAHMHSCIPAEKKHRRRHIEWRSDRHMNR